MHRLPLIVALLGFLYSCSLESPAKPEFSISTNHTKPGTAYSGDAEADSPGVVTSKIDASEVKSDESLPVSEAAQRQLGADLYTNWCAVCHLPIEDSNRRGVDAGKILNDYTRNFPTHKSIPWPNATEAYWIERVLAPSNP